MKKKLKVLIFWFLKVGIAEGIAVFLLSLVSMLYDYTGVHIESKTGATDYTWEPNQWRANMTEGFAWVKMDGNGYNNAYEADHRDIDVLLMGSSHMEALNIGAKENVAYRLNELVPDFYTYNIGISGHTIYHCVNNLKDAVQAFHPSQWVVMETDQVALNVQEMQHVISGNYARIPSYDSGGMYYLQKYVPAAKTIYNKLSDWRQLDNVPACVDGEVVANTASAEYEEILGRFLSLAAAALEPEQKLLIFYQPGTSIRADGSYASEDDGMVGMFAQACKEEGITFVDMTQDFKVMYEEQKILAHGFMNTAVGVGHLNAYGHEIIARRLASVLEAEYRRDGGAER